MKFKLALLICFLIAPEAAAHQLGESYIFVKCTEQTIDGRVEIMLDDLDRVIGLDQTATVLSRTVAIDQKKCRYEAAILTRTK